MPEPKTPPKTPPKDTPPVDVDAFLNEMKTQFGALGKQFKEVADKVGEEAQYHFDLGQAPGALRRGAQDAAADQEDRRQGRRVVGPQAGVTAAHETPRAQRPRSLCGLGALGG